MQLPITVGLHRSRFLDGVLALTALAASGAALAFPIPLYFRLLMLIVVWGGAWLAWVRLAPPLSVLRLERDGRISAVRAGEEEFIPARLLLGATVHPWLTVLRLELAEAPACNLLATVDSLNAQDFRRLRSFLRWRADFSVGRDDA